METNRMAGALADVSANRESSIGEPDESHSVTAERIRNLIRARRHRRDYLPGEFFADPAWDILLVLFHSHLMQMRVSISDLSKRCEVPMTTALRWLTAMSERGLIARRSDPFDARRVYVELSYTGYKALKRYFADHGLYL